MTTGYKRIHEKQLIALLLDIPCALVHKCITIFMFLLDIDYIINNNWIINFLNTDKRFPPFVSIYNLH